MPAASAVISILVYDTDGTTAKQNVSVTLTNQTNPSETQQGDTDGNGQIIFNLANFDTDWEAGDIIEIYALYASTEATDTFQATGSTDRTLTLATRTSSAELRYFTTTEFLDTVQMNESAVDSKNGLSAGTIQLVGEAQEDHIDRILGQKFDSNGGEYYTVTQELHNSLGVPRTWGGIGMINVYSQHLYFTRQAPIISLTTFEVNLQGPDQDADWETLTEADNEITVRLEYGRIKINDSTNYPAAGKDQVRITYTYGYATVPNDIKRLAILMTARAMNLNTAGRLGISAIEAEGMSATMLGMLNNSDEINSIIDNRKLKGVYYV